MVEAAANSSAPIRPWLARGVSGKLLVMGSVAGIIAVFLPLASISVDMGAPAGMFQFQGAANMPQFQFGPAMNKSAMVVENWRGKVCLAGYLATLALAIVLHPTSVEQQKTLYWATPIIGLVVLVMAVWMLWLIVNSQSASVMGMGGIRTSVGFGAILNLLTAAAVAAGGFLQAKEARLM
jgi:hypothetical protein